MQEETSDAGKAKPTRRLKRPRSIKPAKKRSKKPKQDAPAGNLPAADIAGPSTSNTHTIRQVRRIRTCSMAELQVPTCSKEPEQATSSDHDAETVTQTIKKKVLRPYLYVPTKHKSVARPRPAPQEPQADEEVTHPRYYTRSVARKLAASAARGEVQTASAGRAEPPVSARQQLGSPAPVAHSLPRPPAALTKNTHKEHEMKLMFTSREPQMLNQSAAGEYLITPQCSGTRRDRVYDQCNTRVMADDNFFTIFSIVRRNVRRALSAYLSSELTRMFLRIPWTTGALSNVIPIAHDLSSGNISPAVQPQVRRRSVRRDS